MKEKNGGEDRENKTAEAGVVSLSLTQSHLNMQEVKTWIRRNVNAIKLEAKRFVAQ